MNQKKIYFFDPFQLSPQSPLSKKEHLLSFLALYLQSEEDCLLTSASIDDVEWQKIKNNYGLSGSIKVLENSTLFEQFIQQQGQGIGKLRNRWFFPELNENSFLKLANKVHFTQMMNYLFPSLNKARSIKVGDLVSTAFERPVVLKYAMGQTGQQVFMINDGERWQEVLDLLEQQLAGSDQVVLDPWLPRVMDFSVAWTDQGRWIYRNYVDEAGQYRFTFIDPETVYKVDLFLFSLGVKESEVKAFELRLLEIEKELNRRAFPSRFKGCMDFFLYAKNSSSQLVPPGKLPKLYVHPGCEINPRLSMGVLGHFIAQKIIGEDLQGSFLFGFKKAIDQYLHQQDSGLKKLSIKGGYSKEFLLSPNGLPTLVLRQFCV